MSATNLTKEDMRQVLAEAMRVQRVDFTKEDMRQVVMEAVAEAVREQRESEDNKMLTREDVCRICHISLPTFHAWVNNGTIEAQKVGRRTLVEAKSLDEAIRRGKIHTFKHKD